jgi:hypothetical protein
MNRLRLTWASPMTALAALATCSSIPRSVRRAQSAVVRPRYDRANPAPMIKVRSSSRGHGGLINQLRAGGMKIID